MAKNVKPLFGTSTTFSEAAGTGDVNGTKILTDYPPTDSNVGSIFIHNDGTGGAVVVTVKLQFYSGVDWGKVHTVLDDDGNTLTFSANSDTDVEANLYAQAFWKENDGFRIVLSRASSTLIAGTATAVVR